MTGRVIRIWADTRRVHLLAGGHQIKTPALPAGRQGPARLRASGAVPAGAPPLPPTSGEIIEVERTVNASGNISVGNHVISAGSPLAGQRVTLRLTGYGTIVRTIACPVPQPARHRLRGARAGTAGPPQLPPR